MEALYEKITLWEWENYSEYEKITHLKKQCAGDIAGGGPFLNYSNFGKSETSTDNHSNQQHVVKVA